MHSVLLADETDFAGWRAAARRLALADVPPEQVVWAVRELADLFADPHAPAAEAPPAGTFSVPRALVGLAEEVIQAREPERFALLYGLVWRAHRGERQLLQDAADPQVQRALRLAQSVRRDTHKMRAFVRFREVREPAGAGRGGDAGAEAGGKDEGHGPVASHVGTGAAAPVEPADPPGGAGVVPAASPGGTGAAVTLEKGQAGGTGTAGAGADAAGGIVRDGGAERAGASVPGGMHLADAEVDGAEPPVRYVAWFEPEHYILEANAPFFVRRFATMTWSILTPYRSAHWDGEHLAFTEGANPADVPDDDALARYWQAYFSAIFNPARLKVAAMTSEMPRKYWRNLPEAAAIPGLIRDARARTERMVDAASEPPLRAGPTSAGDPRSPAEPPGPGQPRLPAEPPLRGQPAAPAHKDRRMPASPRAAPSAPDPVPTAEHLPGDLAALAREAAACRRCHLWEPATQTVFGEGPHDARLMMVGEQPGDQEDLAGRPFVGPAGQMLDRAILEAGIDRTQVYVTNAVKHFKFEPRGRRRIHAKPDVGEITACRFWLDQERRAVRPALTVALGASAARAVLGRAVTISRERGRPIAQGEGNAQVLVTVHPSYLLRLPDEDAKVREYAAFVADLRLAALLVA